MSWPKEIPFNRYPSDLTHEEWEIIKPILEELEPRRSRGRPREVDLREILNAIFYLNKTGCQWRYLPKDFPSYTLVSYYYHRWLDNGILEKINTTIHRNLRKEMGRNETPSAAMIDSQSVKGTQECVDQTGFDGGKLVKGRKRHILVDTMGYIIVVRVHAANIYDGHGARTVLNAGFSVVDTIKKIWADCGYRGEEFIKWVEKEFNCIIEIVQKNNKTGSGFQVLPRRWVVERTLAWLGRFRRLSKDYERKPTSSEGHVYIASIRLMLRKICKNRALLQEPVLEAA
ncbi:MAG: IS5 family transposase [Gammaproteobacteria bacterium]|jgi:putative transposase|nr:IS5 family transposase [Gammaproteobacteria bacterium]